MQKPAINQFFRRGIFTALCLFTFDAAGLAGEIYSGLAEKFAPLGKLVVTQFVSAPFPHPARAAGRTRNGEFFSAAGHYSDSTVALFIPNGFRVTDRIDFVVHFHGWSNTVAGTLAQFDLIPQFCRSGKNAILIVPQGPLNAPDSFYGKLEDTNGFKVFMDEAVEKLRTSCGFSERGLQAVSTPITNSALKRPEGRAPKIGNVILSGHSGGYHAMAAIVEQGGMPIQEAWLFDALYGNAENFIAWQKRANGRMVNIYTDHGGTKSESEKLMANCQTNGVRFISLEETNLAAADLQREKIVFIHTDLTHNEVIFRRGEFSLFMKTSGLEER